MPLGVVLSLMGVAVLCLGFFAGSETALFGAPRARLQARAKERNRRALVALSLLEKPRNLLASILLGSTFINIGLGVLVVSLGHGLAEKMGVPENRLTLVVLGLDLAATLVILVFGEVTPKLFSARDPERLALMAAPFLAIFTVVVRPLVVVFLALSETLLRGFGVSLANSPSVTKEEIQTLVSVGENTGVLEPEEADMVEGFFDFK